MGASGAGKTTLLNILGCQSQEYNGSITANKNVYSESNFGYFANYVMQFDTLMNTMTVFQLFKFSAELTFNKHSVNI